MSDRAPFDNMDFKNPEENHEFGYLDKAIGKVIGKEEQKQEDIQKMKNREVDEGEEEEGVFDNPECKNAYKCDKAEMIKMENGKCH